MHLHSLMCVPAFVQIIHLDLKSHNILLGRGGIAKIADVGLAKIMSRSATRASAAGTFDWAAPGVYQTQPCPGWCACL